MKRCCWLFWVPVAWLGALAFFLVFPFWLLEMRIRGFPKSDAQLRE
jgi:hypothetical protein